MAGDKIVDCTQNGNNEKINENGDLSLSLNLEDDFIESIEYVPCPEFQFSTTACYICNGYYGPCFEEPVCATCHAFVFPNDVDLLQMPIFSEKTDDEDSGNDEPTDLYYNHERRTSQQQQNSPQNVNPNIPNAQQNPLNHNANISRRCYPQYQNVTPQCNYHTLQSNSNSSNSVDICVVGSARNTSTSRDVNLDLQSMVCRTRVDCHQNYANRNDLNAHDRVEENLRNMPEMFALGHDGQNNEPGQYHWNYRVYEDVGEPSRPYNLSERLEILSNHKHIEHEPINEPGLVERLPPEVLLAIFSHLDDISLWSAANVCRRWCGLLSTHVTQLQWKQHVKLRWPLYKPIGCIKNWYKVYDHLASSAPCRTCLAQTSLRSRPARMEENSWRRNRLRSELKSLRIDPPEGIEAMPLDHMCCHWQATITGPVGSPYEGGLFYLYLQVPFSYPMCPPIVRFLTKILHPNVSRHGDVGIDSIHHNWSLALTISKVLISVQSLLTDPYCQVCMEPELGEMYMSDREKFEEVARAWTWRYAMHDVVTPL
ncbi:Ubiquitin-conjugating enzyme E2 5A [Atta colombica]|uniref:E2 ubiquitin-conjugating enzyme n=2 Tax=Atta colombica TaxID=520822 RepID=A0A195ATM2_9HYME|nr:Ubiquitin-conjugating enzyme E2 5A [Atta colombica]